MRIIPFLIAGLLISSASALSAPAQPSLWLEEMTWTEVKTQIAAGNNTVLIPTGGTEQNGPHIALGKHNKIVAYTAEAVAKKLGDTLIAPVIAYVPEGTISPPQGHMRFPGTLSVREEIFEGLLEDTARSLKQAGFRTICFIGDSGGNQQGQKNVADKLNREWKATGVQVLHVSGYYAPKAADDYAASHKLGSGNAQAHGGYMDTAELLVSYPAGVRKDAAANHAKEDANVTGSAGDATGASAKEGKALLQFKIDGAVAQIQSARK